jgi:hypothetical protein
VAVKDVHEVIQLAFQILMVLPDVLIWGLSEEGKEDNGGEDSHPDHNSPQVNPHDFYCLSLTPLRSATDDENQLSRLEHQMAMMEEDARDMLYSATTKSIIKCIAIQQKQIGWTCRYLQQELTLS